MKRIDHRSTTKKLVGMSEAADRRNWRELVSTWSVPSLKEGLTRYTIHANAGTSWLGMPVGFYRARVYAMRDELRKRGDYEYLIEWTRDLAFGE
jgi:hypothetical protein